MLDFTPHQPESNPQLLLEAKAVSVILDFLSFSGRGADFDCSKHDTNVTGALAAMRQWYDSKPRDQYGMILELPPDMVSQAYDLLYRRYNPTSNELARYLCGDEGWAARKSPSGLNQRGAFPDEDKGAVIREFALPGRWRFLSEAPCSTALVLRTLDAAHQACPGLSDAGVTMRFVAHLPPESEGIEIDPQQREIKVDSGFVCLPMEEQRQRYAVLRQQLEEFPESLPTTNIESGRHVNVNPPPDVTLVTLGMVMISRARDYTHYRFNYRIGVEAERLKERGVSAESVSIEDEVGISRFLNNYRNRPADVVVLSLYQHFPADMQYLGELIKSLREINPACFIVLEGTATQPANQMLAMFPDVDILVRGESNEILDHLVQIKRRGSALSASEALAVAEMAEHGLFMRCDGGGFFVNFDHEQHDSHPQLQHPIREMQAVWYSERGCPCSCGFCPQYTGWQSEDRVVSALDRIEWMVDRLYQEVALGCSLSRDELKEALKVEADSPNTHLSGLEGKLRDDTFIGIDKVDITVVSENALVHRKVWIEFADAVKELGLQKYFRIKVADATVRTLYRNDSPDRELMRALKVAGVYFVGLGTESLSTAILSDLQKGYSLDAPAGYTADIPIQVNAALLEEGFAPQGVRHNFMSNAPDSTLSDVKAGLVLGYIAPLYNSAVGCLGNGWGNSRENRLYAMEGSLHTAIDALRYGYLTKLQGPELTENVQDCGDYYVSVEAPEYMIRREGAQLRYLDERVHPLAAAFTYPTFYRYAMVDFVRGHVAGEELKEMTEAWRNEASSVELQALGTLLTTYLEMHEPHQALFALKAHMVAAECFSFCQWQSKLDSDPSLLQKMEDAAISELISQADDCMRPHRFDACEALQCLENAREAAAAICPGVQRIALDSEKPHLRLGYPDRQQFEHLQLTFPLRKPDQLLENLSLEVQRAARNQENSSFVDGVRNLICRELSLDLDEYPRYLKLLKEYETIGIFGRGGLISRLASESPEQSLAALEQLLPIAARTSNSFLADLIVHHTECLGQAASPNRTYALVLPASDIKVLAKLVHSSDEMVVHFGERVLCFSVDLHNTQRASIIGELDNISQHWKDTVVAGSFRGGVLSDGEGTVQSVSTDAFLNEHGMRMRFGNNATLFSRYLEGLSLVGNRHQEVLLEQISQFLEQFPGQEFSRYYMLPEEMFLYMLPLIKRAQQEPGMQYVFMMRGMEPLMSVYNQLESEFSKEFSIPSAIPLKVFRGFDATGNRKEMPEYFFSRSILTTLAEEERNSRPSPEVWRKISDAVNCSGEAEGLNAYLKRRWDISDLSTLMEEQPTLERAVNALAEYGVDQRFVGLVWRTWKGRFGTEIITPLRESGQLTLTDLIGELKRINEDRLEGAFSELEIDDMEEGLSGMADQHGRLEHVPTELLSGAMRIYGNGSMLGELRAEARHTARPWLNLLLENTTFSQKLTADSASPKVVCIDETSISGTSLIASELTLKAFSPNVRYESHNIVQRTPGTAEFLMNRGAIDSCSVGGIWLQEDMVRLYQGYYQDPADGCHKVYRSFEELCEQLAEKQAQRRPIALDEAPRAVAELDREIDCFTAQHNYLIEELNSHPEGRYPRSELLRQVVKLHLRSNEPDTKSFQRMLVDYDILQPAEPFQADFSRWFRVRDSISKVLVRVEEIEEASPESLSSIRHKDYLVRYCDLQQNFMRNIKDFEALECTIRERGQEFLSGSHKESIQRYLQSGVTFEQLCSEFYCE